MTEFVQALQGLPTWTVWLGQGFIVYAAVLVMMRTLGAAGLLLTIPLLMVAANILVLRGAEFPWFSHPVALGTIVFTAIFLCVDLLAEHYGPAAARRGVLAGFLGYGLFVLVIVSGVSIAPLSAEVAASDPNNGWMASNHEAMTSLFIPAPVFLLAGLVAYGVSTLLDIWVFQRLRRATQGKALWLRNTGSTMVASLVDNTVFSLLAFKLLAEEPVGWEPLLMTFILGTLLVRWALALVDTPFMYLAARIRRPDSPEPQA